LQLDAVELLVSRGAHVNAEISNRTTALHVVGEKITDTDDASSARRAKIIELLIAHGANVDARRRGGETPLIANATDANAVAVLPPHRADVNPRTRGGDTPPLRAATPGWGTPHALKLLSHPHAALPSPD